MISPIFMHFQAILIKSSLTAGIFLRALSNPLFKSKIPLGYPKILIILTLMSRHETKKAKNGVTSTVNLTLHKDLILKTPKQREKPERLE